MAVDCEGWARLWPCLGWPFAGPIFIVILIGISGITLCATRGTNSPLAAHRRALTICTLCGSAFMCVYQAAILALLDADQAGKLTRYTFGLNIINFAIWAYNLAGQLRVEKWKKERARAAALRRELAEAIVAAAIGETEAVLRILAGILAGLGD